MIISDYKHGQVLRTIGSGEGQRIGGGFLHKNNANQARKSFCFEHYVGVLVLRGQGKHIDHSGGVFDLEPGCFYQRFPDMPHETRVTSEIWLECFLAIPADLFRALCSLGFLDGRHPVLRPGTDLPFIDFCDEIRGRVRTAAESELPTILLEMQRNLIRIVQLDREGPGWAHQQICRACERLSAHLDQRYAVEDIARDVGMGYESFRKHFRRQIGVPPGEYRIRRRIDAACTQLMNHQANIAEIAESLGYQNPALFTRQFKRVTGMPPRDFRSRL